MSEDSKKTPCKFGSKCYRKNPQHLEEYSHPEPECRPKKKAKIEDHFASGDSDAEKEEIDKKPDGESGYSRHDGASVDEANNGAKQSSAGESSGYVREEDSDEEDDASSSKPPESPEDIKQNIKAKFLVSMPEDFYDFWEFCQTKSSKNPCDALMSTLGLQLVGPFDILAGKHKKSKVKSPCYLRHWRYYYDPPEFQTVIRGEDKSLFHMGYFRDDVNESPVFVASNEAKVNCNISPRGENIFAAVHWFLDDKMKKEKIKTGPLTKLKEDLVGAAKKGGYSLDQKTKAMKDRDKKSVCKTFHGAGMVVPVDENEVGYRPVPETPADLKRIFKKIADAKDESERNTAMDPLMEIIMYVQFANDECDYGEGLELGLDLFSYGGEGFHKLILNLLPLAYQLLRRQEFGEIVKAHLADRKLSADLNVL